MCIIWVVAMGRRQLTAKQHRFLLFLLEFSERHSVWPTYREIEEHFGFASPNSVTQNLQALHRKGYLLQDDNGYRIADDVVAEQRRTGIPVRGMITAGVLQEAVEADLGEITLELLFPNLDRIYAVRVSGESMIGADIHDGDYVLLMDDDIPNGGIGAVLYDGETSLKRIYYDQNGLRLEPANDEYSSIRIEPDVFEEVRILGKYVGHVNRTGIFRRTPTGRAA